MKRDANLNENVPEMECLPVRYNKGLDPRCSCRWWEAVSGSRVVSPVGIVGVVGPEIGVVGDQIWVLQRHYIQTVGVVACNENTWVYN